MEFDDAVDYVFRNMDGLLRRLAAVEEKELLNSEISLALSDFRDYSNSLDAMWFAETKLVELGIKNAIENYTQELINSTTLIFNATALQRARAYCKVLKGEVIWPT